MEWLPLESWASSEQAAQVREIWDEPHLKAAVKALDDLQITPLLVGGVVRDLVLQRENKDVDLIVCCTAHKLIRLQSKLSRATSGTAVPLDRERGIVRLCFSGGIEIDLVSLQGETLSDDLQGRDLRINAMLIDPEGRLADPTGGLKDIKNRSLHAVADENFERDPLRVIRLLRFAAQLSFQPAQDATKFALRAVSGLRRVAGERISAELVKFFEHAGPEQMELLAQFGLREQLCESADAEQAEISRELLHGVSLTRPLGFRFGLAIFFGPILEAGEKRESLFERLRLSRKTRRYLDHWWNGAAYCKSLETVSPKEVFRLFKIAGMAFQDLASLLHLEAFPSPLSSAEREMVQAEAQGRGALRWEAFPWTGHQLAEALGKPAGKWMGPVLATLEEAWALRKIQSLEEMRSLAMRSQLGSDKL